MNMTRGEKITELYGIGREDALVPCPLTMKAESYNFRDWTNYFLTSVLKGTIFSIRFV